MKFNKTNKKNRVKRYMSFALIMTMIALSMSACGKLSDNGILEERTDLKIAVDSDVDTLIPWASQLGVTFITKTLLYEPLIYFDPVSSKVTYYLADSYDVAEDGMSYTFHLKKEAKFSDGTPVTAKDVVFTAEMYMNSYEQSECMSVVDSIEAIDDYTVKFNMMHPHAPFIININNLYVVPEKAFNEAGKDNFSENPVGSGRYVLSSWSAATKLIFERNKNYEGEPAALEKIELIVMADSMARATSLEAGDVDVAQVDSANVKTLSEVNGLKLVEVPTTKFCIITMNMDHEIFKDEKVRRAVSYAMNRDYIVKVALSGYGDATSIIYTPSTFGYSEDVPTYDFDIDKAKKLLAEANVATPYDLGILTCNAGGSMTAEVVQAQLAELGLNVELQILETGTFYDGLFGGNYDMAVARLGWEYDASGYDIMFSSEGIGNMNTSQYVNKDLEEMMSQAKATVDDSERLKLYKEIATVIQGECIYVPLYTYPDLWFQKSNLKGEYRPNSTIEFGNFSWTE